ncbi:hypothetical protein MRX96_006780 [Rhipicephalus microplus]
MWLCACLPFSRLISGLDCTIENSEDFVEVCTNAAQRNPKRESQKEAGMQTRRRIRRPYEEPVLRPPSTGQRSPAALCLARRERRALTCQHNDPDALDQTVQ